MDNWISASERLPESGENVLIYHKDYGIGIGYCMPLDKSFAGTFHGISVIDEDKLTTHWQPLPPPPKQVVHTPEETNAWDNEMDN